MERWLLLDVSNLCHRAFHAHGELSYEGRPTAALYGVFKDIVFLKERFDTDRIAFIFDGGYDKRTQLMPRYKQSRRTPSKEMPPEEKAARSALRRQIYGLRINHLPDMGYRNVFLQEGYEADDVIAKLCESHGEDPDKKMIVVSGDSDLLQVIGPRVSVWSPIKKELITAKSFREKWKISPSQWADVKALAGCSSDDIPGIQRIGDITAAKFLAGNLKTTSRAYENIIECNSVWGRNLKLTKLPIEGTMDFELVDNECTSEKWDAVMRSLGMTSLIKGRRG